MSKVKWFLYSMIICLVFSFVTINVVKATPSEAYIDVAVATLWTEPNIARNIDQPAIMNPVDIRKWTQNMQLNDKTWLVQNLETQALYGQKVKILEEKGNWVKVAIPNQPTPRHLDGYPGWLPKAQLSYNPDFALYTDQPFIRVKATTTWLYNHPTTKESFMEISFNTHLPLVKQAGDWLAVATPSSGIKWISANAVIVYTSEAAIPVPTSEELINTAKQFLDLPYLWAGTSGFGFDCSGFVYTLYNFYGITIPRDSSAQATVGIPVAKENLQPGDLIFFAYNNGKGRVHHVAMYIGNGQMIHSPNSDRSIEILPLSQPAYASTYAGARRFLP